MVELVLQDFFLSVSNRFGTFCTKKLKMKKMSLFLNLVAKMFDKFCVSFYKFLCKILFCFCIM